MSKQQAFACVESRKDGQPCRSRPLPSNTYCWAHAPELENQRAEARRRGGLNSSGPARLRRMFPGRLSPVARELERALEEVHAGDLPPATAQAMASIARALVAVFTSGEFEARLRRLESPELARDNSP